MKRDVKEAILHAIAHGALSREETETRLRDLIEEELDKPEQESNTELVQECTRLLHEFYGGTEPIHPGRKEASKNALLRRLEKRKQRRQAVITTLSAAAALALMVSFSPKGFSSWKLFHKSELTARNAYVMTGLSGAGVFPNPSKIKTDTSEYIYAKTYEEIVEFLGYTPYNPTDVFEDWMPVEYYAAVDNKQVLFFVGFKKGDSKQYVNYESSYYFLMEDIESNLQFNGEATIVHVEDKDIAFMQNKDDNSCIWSDDNMTYRIAGDISDDDIKRYTMDVIRGNNQW